MPDLTTFETLKGPEKAAVLLLALGEERAATILGRLELSEVKALSATLAGVGRVEPDVVEMVLREFGERFGAAGGVAGGIETAQKLLARVLDNERAEAIIEEIRGPTTRSVWERLVTIDEASLAGYLRKEYPQTVAVVLSRLDPAHAARVLAQFPDEFAGDVIQRILRLELVGEDVLADVERTLQNEFVAGFAAGSRPDPHQIVAEIFNHFDRAAEARLMAQLEERDKEAAERIRASMFTFEDLARLDATGIQRLIRNAGNDRIAVALKGASEQIRTLFFANMSERAAKILREEMEAMGPVRLRDVEEAQQFLVNMAKELIATGDVVLADNKDEQMVY